MDLPRYFDPKVGREGVFKPTMQNETLLEISNDNNMVKLAYFAT
jgi:hypothetical protein